MNFVYVCVCVRIAAPGNEQSSAVGEVLSIGHHQILEAPQGCNPAKNAVIHARMYFQGFSVFNRTQLCRAKANNIFSPGRCLDVGQYLPCPNFEVVCEVFSIFFGLRVWTHPWVYMRDRQKEILDCAGEARLCMNPVL